MRLDYQKNQIINEMNKLIDDRMKYYDTLRETLGEGEINIDSGIFSKKNMDS